MRVIVADDEPLALRRLVRMLNTIEGVQVVAEAFDGERAADCIAQFKPDVALLDINMPGLDGLAVAELAGDTKLVFVTAHVQHAAEAFEVDAVDYLIKPVRLERLKKALSRVQRRVQTQSQEPKPEASVRLVVQDGASSQFVDAREVDAFVASDKYTEFFLKGREYLVRDSLGTLEERLEGHGFIRTHRSALVRQEAISKLTQVEGAATVTLEDGRNLPVSRRRTADIKRMLRQQN